MAGVKLAKKVTVGGVPLTPLTINQVMDKVAKKEHTEREKVGEAWTTLTDAERIEVCHECQSYFPDGEGGFTCLVGHKQNWNKPCALFSRAIFRLVDDWQYSLRQAFLLKQLETTCRRYAGEDDDEEE